MSNSNRPTDDTVLRPVPPAPRAPDDAARPSSGKPVLRAIETQSAPHLAPAAAAPAPQAGAPTPPVADLDLTGLLEDGSVGEVSALIEDATARIQHRAALIATFASLKGTNVPLSDIAEYMWRNDPGDVSVDSLAKALQTTGMQAQISHQVPLTPESWPALAMMNNGQCVLVLSQTRETISIYDTTCADNRAEVPLAEFGPYFTGTTLGARNSLKQIAARHTPQLESDHWFWGEFPKYRRQVGEIMLGSLVANILAVSVALFSLQVYDRVVPHQSHATLWVLAFGAFLAIMLEALLKLARARLTDAAGRQIELSVQNNLMRRLIGMRSDKKPLPPSGLFAAMRDFGSVREFFTSTTISTLADIPFIAVFLLLVASIAGPIVWIIIAGGILMLLPAYFMQKRMITLTRQTQGANAKAGRLLHEVVNELDTLKSQRGEDRVLRLWDELNTLSTHAATEQRRLSSALTHWSQGVQQATYIGSVVVGTLMVFAGEFTVGTIIATGILTSRTLAPLTQFAATLARWSNVKGALEGLDAIANSAQEKEDERSYLRRDSLEGRFELREVMFRYDEDGAPTLDVPGVAVTPGQRVAVLGVNGSGKSTLLKLMSGLYVPDRGRVMIDGTDMTQIDPRDLRRHIGYLSQDVRLFAGTLRENLNLNQLERDDDRLMTALDFAGLGAHVRNHHKGLDLEIFDGGGGLSIGQRQSIGWARLWLQNPSIVLLDEPTAALDQTLERTLVSRLETWLEGRTTVIATHRMPILSLTNRTLILQSGRMVVDGPRDQVLAHLAAGEGK
ncbi:ATP-binding cassette domain-containing protein [Phaeobacter porticola]|uniref:Putative ATP-binding/permease fusion ABC transporter n=1 Tax=Phaeobacter porticola TaxID=1844006 RepID=A0A1L3I0I2_9RHOB|nr:ATP-binding cassette domain-containing protein [Phaeobacter porticola]APG45639.1 putative ATP-binding/permease fusion ABC transporter [Phaeobacter porticola]